MTRIVKIAATAAVTLALAIGGVPLGTGGTATTNGTGSTGCCKQ